MIGALQAPTFAPAWAVLATVVIRARKTPATRTNFLICLPPPRRETRPLHMGECVRNFITKRARKKCENYALASTHNGRSAATRRASKEVDGSFQTLRNSSGDTV